jgi:hypothetical protein
MTHQSVAAAALVALFALPALGQEADPACEVLGRVLTEARDAETLDRLLREQAFSFVQEFQGGPNGQLIRMEGVMVSRSALAVLEDGEEVLSHSFAMGMTTPDGEQMQLSMTTWIGFDGQLRGMTGRNEQTRGNGELQITELQGQVTDGTLVMTEQSGKNDKQTREEELGDDVIPMFTAMFALPALEADLPAELAFRPFMDRVQNDAMVLRRGEAGQTADGVAYRLMVLEQPNNKGQGVFELLVATDGDQAGQILHFKQVYPDDSPQPGRMEFTRVTDEGDLADLRERFGFEAAPPETDDGETPEAEAAPAPPEPELPDDDDVPPDDDDVPPDDDDDDEAPRDD